MLSLDSLLIVYVQCPDQLSNKQTGGLRHLAAVASARQQLAKPPVSVLAHCRVTDFVDEP